MAALLALPPLLRLPLPLLMQHRTTWRQPLAVLLPKQALLALTPAWQQAVSATAAGGAGGAAAAQLPPIAHRAHWLPMLQV